MILTLLIFGCEQSVDVINQDARVVTSVSARREGRDLVFTAIGMMPDGCTKLTVAHSGKGPSTEISLRLGMQTPTDVGCLTVLTPDTLHYLITDVPKEPLRLRITAVFDTTWSGSVRDTMLLVP
ncbi:MAG: hypothetical protein MUC47_03445 [Candidatus Kapabacteria bacterium]|nr:hypothetical protein [Candidatus Kapabacteria bacterium]